MTERAGSSCFSHHSLLTASATLSQLSTSFSHLLVNSRNLVQLQSQKQNSFRQKSLLLTPYILQWANYPQAILITGYADNSLLVLDVAQQRFTKGESITEGK